jgi:hypothetical protein
MPAVNLDPEPPLVGGILYLPGLHISHPGLHWILFPIIRLLRLPIGHRNIHA